MAGKKQRNPASASKHAEFESPTHRGPASTAKQQKSLKGRVEFEKIDCEEEKAKKQPARRGVLRGLDPNALAVSHPEQTIEGTDDSGHYVKIARSTHATRGSVYGRTTTPNYNTKYHPIDEAIRPSNAAKYGPGVKSESASAQRESDGETSEDSERTMAGDSESEDSDSDIEDVPIATQRVPDPKAVRHSARSEAQKAVNYSRKYHPQDLSLSGHRSKAKAAIKSGEMLPPPKVSKRKSTEVAMDDDPSEHDVSAEKSASTPRKRLKSTASGSPSALKARKKPQSRKGQPGKTQSKQAKGSTVLGAALGDMAQGWSQQKPTALSDDLGEDDSDEHEPNTDFDQEQHVQESPLDREASVLSQAVTQVDAGPSMHENAALDPFDPPASALPSSLTVARPYFTGYVPTALDPRSLVNAPPTQMPSQLHISSPDHFNTPPDGIETSAAAAVRDNIVASTKVRSSRAATPETRDGSSPVRAKHAHQKLEVDDHDDYAAAQTNTVSHFEEQLAITEHQAIDQVFRELSEYTGMDEEANNSSSQHDGPRSSSSHIVPPLDHEKKDGSHLPPASSAPDATIGALESAGHSTASRRPSLTGSATLPSKAALALGMMPATAVSERRGPSSRTLSAAAPAASEQRSHTLSAGTAVSAAIEGMHDSSRTLSAGRESVAYSDAESPHDVEPSSSQTSSPTRSAPMNFDGAGEYEMLWQASEKPGAAWL